MDNNEPLIMRIDDHLLQVIILGENSDGTLAVEYNVISKDPDEKIDHDDIGKKLSLAINAALESYLENLETP